jgi:hypothetical protein
MPLEVIQAAGSLPVCSGAGLVLSGWSHFASTTCFMMPKAKEAGSGDFGLRLFFAAIRMLYHP